MSLRFVNTQERIRELRLAVMQGRVPISFARRVLWRAARDAEEAGDDDAARYAHVASASLARNPFKDAMKRHGAERARWLDSRRLRSGR